MNKKLIWASIFVGFLVVAGGVAMLAKNMLPKTTALDLSITDCKFQTSKPFEFDKDQTVKLSVTADKAGQFTLDNYDINENVSTNQAKSLTFKTVRSGVFDAKLSGCTEHAKMIVRNADGTTPETQEHDEVDAEKAEESSDHNESDNTQPSNENTNTPPASDGRAEETPHAE